MRTKKIVNLAFIMLAIILISINVTAVQNLLFDFFQLKIKYQDKLRPMIHKNSIILFLLSFFVTLLWNYYKKLKIESLVLIIKKQGEKLISGIKFEYTLILILLYLGVLVTLAVQYYDLGIDEVWYILYARNFCEHLVPFTSVNDEIARLDIIAMLPYYLLYSLYQSISEPSLIGIKILSSLISLISIGIIVKTLKNKYDKSVLTLFISLLVFQPGFGFVATSVFGEICAVMFIFVGAHYVFNKDKGLLGSLLLCLSIHTKFQLVYIILFSLTVIAVLYRDRFIFRVLLSTFLFSVILIVLRGLPLFFNHLRTFTEVLREFFSFATGYDKGPSWVIIERIQLYNRLFPVMIFAIIIPFSLMILENKFEKFLFTIFLVMNLYWILLFDFVTYRHLYMGIIPACFLLSKILINTYHIYVKNSFANKTSIRISVIFSVIVLFSLGASSNLVHAYIGYNDGVQFDLDGYQSRLFNEIKHDMKQQTFYRNIKNQISSNDIIFSDSPQIGNFYISNKIYTLEKINDFKDFPGQKFIIISREAYPNIMEQGEEKIKHLNLRKTYSIKDYSLYKIEKKKTN